MTPSRPMRSQMRHVVRRHTAQWSRHIASVSERPYREVVAYYIFSTGLCNCLRMDIFQILEYWWKIYGEWNVLVLSCLARAVCSQIRSKIWSRTCCEDKPPFSCFSTSSLHFYSECDHSHYLPRAAGGWIGFRTIDCCVVCPESCLNQEIKKTVADAAILKWGR